MVFFLTNSVFCVFKKSLKSYSIAFDNSRFSESNFSISRGVPVLFSANSSLVFFHKN